MPTERGAKVSVRDRQTIPFVLIPRAFYQAFKPSWKAILAMNALKYYSNNQSGACENISLRTLAAIVNVSQDTLRRGLDELEASGAVAVKKRSRRSAKGDRIPLPNLYEIQPIFSVDDPV